MDDDFIKSPEFNVFGNNRYIRTYSKAHRNTTNVTQNVNTVNNTTIPLIKNDPLTTKNAMQYLLDGTLKHKVCRYCLNVTSDLSELDQYLEVNGQGALYKVTIRDMVASFYPIKVTDDPNLPDKICDKCLDRTISAYLFAQQCEQSERALRNCIEDMYDKLIKLDPLERQKKRGRQKLNPNYNILYAEHKKVIQYAEPLINIINTSSQSLTTEGPIKDYECLKCCQVLPTVDALLNHEKSHPKSMWYNCRLCGKSFPKRYLLKKHANTHLTEKPVKPSANSFHCNTCGEITNDCNEYLQHIEKHKFKAVMQHLVEKNMDELCSVCLDKSSKMTELDSMVCLHGGHMDMTGDRNIYNILASTIPDPNLYKYQELIIPSKARIMTIVKKDKHNGSVTNLYFANPIILTTDKIEIAEVYIFFFSSPLKVTPHIERQKETKTYELSTESQILNEFEEIHNVKSDSDMINFLDRNESHELDVISNTTQTKMMSAFDDKSQYDDLDYKNGFDNLKEFNKNKNMDICVKDTPIFMFSKPIYLDKSDETPIVEEVTGEINKEDFIEDIKPKLCEVCWVFKDKSCEVCKKNNDEVIFKQFDSNANKTKPCNYCWLFKCVNKCEYCKKPNKIPDTDIKNLNAGAIENNDNKTEISKDLNTPKPKASEATSKEFNVKKVKEAEKKPWKCSICLTTNKADKQTCFCCESEGNTNNSLKIKFGTYTALFKEANEAPTELEGIVNTVKSMDTPEKAMNVIDDKTYDIIEIQDMDIEPIYNVIESKEVTWKPQQVEILNLDENITVVSECSKLVKNNFILEKMDVEETLQEPQPNFNENKQINSLKFEMGSGTSEDKCMRKFKRPLRKMSKAFHK